MSNSPQKTAPTKRRQTRSERRALYAVYKRIEDVPDEYAPRMITFDQLCDWAGLVADLFRSDTHDDDGDEAQLDQYMRRNVEAVRAEPGGFGAIDDERSLVAVDGIVYPASRIGLKRTHAALVLVLGELVEWHSAVLAEIDEDGVVAGETRAVVTLSDELKELLAQGSRHSLTLKTVSAQLMAIYGPKLPLVEALRSLDGLVLRFQWSVLKGGRAVVKLRAKVRLLVRGVADPEEIKWSVGKNAFLPLLLTKEQQEQRDARRALRKNAKKQ